MLNFIENGVLLYFRRENRSNIRMAEDYIIVTTHGEESQIY
jgi:hypothetical protein